jgi:DNA-binding MarR family transcriptional regulator
MRAVGLRTTQYTLLRVINQSGELRQADLSALVVLEETTLTRCLRGLLKSGWVAVRSGTDRREKLVTVTARGLAKLEVARAAWKRAQERLKSRLPDRLWRDLLNTLPEVARLASDLQS